MYTEDAPQVTVVMPAYKTANTLEAAVRSVLKQTMQDFEIIIVEDHSQDQTLALAQTLAAEDPRIRLIALNENKGQAHALNCGIRSARGKWVATLDADDIYLENRLEVLLAYGEREGVEMVADNQQHVDENAGVVVRIAFPKSDGDRILSIHDFINNNSTQSSFSLGILKPMIRTGFIRTHNLSYREGLKLGQDFYYLMEFFVAAGRGYLVAEPYYVWTLPFGPVSRTWTTTGLGAWRYDYSGTIEANKYFIRKMEIAGQTKIVSLLKTREKEYLTMMHYIAAQKTFSQTKSLTRASIIIFKNPSTWSLLFKRVVGRLISR